MIDAAALKQILDSSSQLTTLAISILGGTVAAIISTSYLRPAAIRQRWIYLLFIPGWLFLALSIQAGDHLLRNYLAFLLVDKDKVFSIASAINDAFDNQHTWLLWAVATFVLWLVVYLLFWVFSSTFIPEKKP